MKNNLIFNLFVFSIVLLSVMFLSGCSQKTGGGYSYVCLCRDPSAGPKLAGWMPVINGTTTKALIFSYSKNRNTEYNCYNVCSQSVGALEIGGTSDIVREVYGDNYKLIGFTRNQINNLSSILHLDSLALPGADLYSKSERLASVMGSHNATTLAELFPQFAFLTHLNNSCGKNKYCLTHTDAFTYHTAYVYHIKADFSDMSVLSYNCSSGVSMGNLVRDNCCWYATCSASGGNCNFPKCGKITRWEDIPKCGCICGNKFAYNKTISPGEPACCIHNKLVKVGERGCRINVKTS